MSNEEWLNEKFCMSKYTSYKDLLEDKSAYLLKQVEWMQKYLCDTYNTLYGVTVVNTIDDYDNELTARGSCLLEAIENAQKEMIEE